MYRFKKLLILLFALLCAFLFGGCYTKLMSYQGETMHSGRSSDLQGGNICADGGCPQELPSNTREVCVWERDIFGFPNLRCYNTNYSSAWVYFHNTPWWYRDTYSWYDYRGCPPYYYYDRIAGICRYHGSSPHPHPHPRPPNPDGGGSAPPRHNTRGASQPEQSPSAHSAPSEPAPTGFAPPAPGGSLRQLSPVASPTPPPQQQQQDQGGDQQMTKPQEGTDAPPPSQPPHSDQHNPRGGAGREPPPPRHGTRGGR